VGVPPPRESADRIESKLGFPSGPTLSGHGESLTCAGKDRDERREAQNTVVGREDPKSDQSGDGKLEGGVERVTAD
jgi:hypothetical protein